MVVPAGRQMGAGNSSPEIGGGCPYRKLGTGMSVMQAADHGLGSVTVGAPYASDVPIRHRHTSTRYPRN